LVDHARDWIEMYFILWCESLIGLSKEKGANG
jgi:hypothetical protein